MQKDKFSPFSAANVIKNPFYSEIYHFLSMNFDFIYLIVKITTWRDLYCFIISLKLYFSYLIAMFIP